MDKPKFGSKKLGLGKGLETLLGDDHAFTPSNACKATHPGWKEVQGAKEKYAQLAKKHYEKRYPGCKVTFNDEKSENIDFRCDKALDVYFRVQAGGAFWPKDTLVIAHIYNAPAPQNMSLLLELLRFSISVRDDVGYFNVGFEFPGVLEMQLIKRFGFRRLKRLRGCWIISIAALSERIDTEATCR